MYPARVAESSSTHNTRAERGALSTTRQRSTAVATGGMRYAVAKSLTLDLVLLVLFLYGGSVHFALGRLMIEGGETMAVIVRCRAIVLGLAIIVTGCSAPPNSDVEAAKTAVDKAATEGADRYAPESLKSAQAARPRSTPS